MERIHPCDRRMRKRPVLLWIFKRRNQHFGKFSDTPVPAATTTTIAMTAAVVVAVAATSSAAAAVASTSLQNCSFCRRLFNGPQYDCSSPLAVAVRLTLCTGLGARQQKQTRITVLLRLFSTWRGASLWWRFSSNGHDNGGASDEWATV